MKYLVILFLTLIFIVQSLPFATGATITCTVAINPLTVSVIAPDSVQQGERFMVKAEIGNLGKNKIKDVTASINLPPGLSLIGHNKDKRIGVLPAYRKKALAWWAKADSVGSYIVLVAVSGRDAATGASLEAEDSTLIEVKKSVVMLPLKPSSIFAITMIKYFQSSVRNIYKTS